MDSFRSLIDNASVSRLLSSSADDSGCLNVSADSSSSLLDDAELIYLYDGTLEGMLSAVFAAYSRREQPLNIVESHDLQESMLCSYVPIQTIERHAVRVKKGIIEKLGDRVYDDIKRTFLSDNGEKGGVIYRFIRYTLKAGRWSHTHLAEPAVADLIELKKQVEFEAHYLQQFVRFAELENGVYYAHIEPKANIVPLITDLFVRRLNIQPFIIYDSVHALASVFDTERWWLVSAHEITLPGMSRAEDDFQALWQTFYDTIAVEERKNPTCQRNFMPKRFWGNMCEHIPPEMRKTKASATTPTHAARLLAANQKLLND